MPKIQYTSINLSDWKLELIGKVNDLVAAYREQGYDLTLRQVYYQFVSRDWLPKRWADPETESTNNQRSYKNLGDIVNDGRMDGLIDWHAIEDRTRELDGNTNWRSPDHIIKAVAEQYRIDHWEGQEYRVEIWVEKDALEGVVGKVAKELDCPFFSCRGYTSQTAMWDAGQRLKEISKGGQTPVILHLGDHDPSGIDMSRDIQDRVRLYMDGYGRSLQFDRLALNMPQVREFSPPPNPAKITDSRAKRYIEIHGPESWELDALDPTVIDQILRDAVMPYRNQSAYEERLAKQGVEKQLLRATSIAWSNVEKFLRSKGHFDRAAENPNA